MFAGSFEREGPCLVKLPGQNNLMQSLFAILHISVLFHTNLQDLTQKLMLWVENFCLYITDIWNLLHTLHGLARAGNKPKDLSSFPLQVMYSKLTFHDRQRIFHFGAQDVGAKNCSQVLHTHFVYTWIRLDFIKESVGKKEVLKEQVRRKLKKEKVKACDCSLT